MEFLKAKEARNLTNKCLNEMYNNFLEDLFNEIYDNAQSGKDFITFKIEDCPWWENNELQVCFKQTMRDLGYIVSANENSKEVCISW